MKCKACGHELPGEVILVNGNGNGNGMTNGLWVSCPNCKRILHIKFNENGKKVKKMTLPKQIPIEVAEQLFRFFG